LMVRRSSCDAVRARASRPGEARAAATMLVAPHRALQRDTSLRFRSQETPRAQVDFDRAFREGARARGSILSSSRGPTVSRTRGSAFRSASRSGRAPSSAIACAASSASRSACRTPICPRARSGAHRGGAEARARARADAARSSSHLARKALRRAGEARRERRAATSGTPRRCASTGASCRR
jgi:hypothetical protein